MASLARFARLAGFILVGLAFVPASATAHNYYATWTLAAEGSLVSVYPPDQPHFNVMGCDEQQIVMPGETWWLEYPGLLPQGQENGGHRTWTVGVFYGWYWHWANFFQDTGFSTQRIGGMGNDTHDNVTPNYSESGTRRFLALQPPGGSAYDYEYGLKVVHDTGPWPMIFERGDC
jgi:hypothetical protein